MIASYYSNEKFYKYISVGKFYRYSFIVNPNSKYYEIMINCFELSKNIEEKGYIDSFNIIIYTNELDTYLHFIDRS